MRPTRTRRTVATAVAAALGALCLTTAITPAQAIAAPARNKASSKILKSENAASAKAVATGKTVSVDAATTPTETEVANPNGSFTLNQSVAPVRKYADGVWKPLDNTLVRNADGSISPALTTTSLTLSGGGSGSLAAMKYLGQSMSLSLPASFDGLPTPTLSGNTATYPDVLSGVDLQVVADTQGGFSEVLVVKNATAAADPALTSLHFTTKTKGVSLASDSAGNITAKDHEGRTVFAAPAPRMWDSATSTAGGSSSPSAGHAASSDLTPSVASPAGRVDPRTGDPVESTAKAPGTGAHVAPIQADYHSGVIRLTPDPSLLNSTSTVYPLYIDPSYAAGGVLQAWTYVDSYHSGTSYWKTTDAVGLRVGDQAWETPYYDARAFMQLSVDSRIYGAQVTDSHFYATETYSASCTAKPVQLWLTGGISSSTTWDHQPSFTTLLDTQTVAHGWSPDCPTDSVGWDTTSAMQSAACSSLSKVTLGLRVSDTEESDPDSWKKFDHSTMSMSTTYDHKPTVPSSLSTSPTTTCTSTVKTVGNGDVALYAGVYDKDGGTLSATFKVTKTVGGATVTTKTVSVPSGQNANYTMKKASLDGWLSTTAVTQLSWNVTLSDGSYSVGPSKTCSFKFDPTVPGAPTLTDSSHTYDCGDSDSPVTYQVGQQAAFTIAPNASGSAPASYLYQLNGTAPISTTDTQLNITPTRFTNVLTVTAVSAGGNIGDTVPCTFTASAPATAADGDLTGDGVPDLALVGQQNGLPAGLWLAHGAANGKVLASASQIGPLGTGANAPGGVADWNGTQALVGHFSSGAGFNDVLDYDPGTASGHILYGSGDGTALSPYSEDEGNVSDPAFEDSDGNIATSIASGGDLFNTVNGNPVTGFPDLIAVIDGQLWDEAADPTPGAFVGMDNNLPLSTANPADGGSWTGWTISTTLVDGLPALFARPGTGGTVYYYSPTEVQNLAFGAGTAVALSLGSTPALMQAADLDNDGTSDLWTVDSSGAVTAHLLDLTPTPQLVAQGSQTPATGTHAWPLTDGTDGTATTAADVTGTTALPLAGPTPTDTAAWESDGGLFDPHLLLNGTSTGYLHTSAKALDLTNSFTVSVWAAPAAYGGAVLSQDGSADSGIELIPTSGGWQFSLNTGSGTAASFDTVTGGTVHLGTWTHVTATYDKTVKIMKLYVDNVFVDTGSHTAPGTGATGNFEVGDYQNAGARTGYFNGELAQVQTFTGSALAPTQPYSPASYHQAITPTRILDTRSGGVLTYTSGVTAGTATLVSGSITPLKIAGDSVTSTSGSTVTIPSTVTAVAIDVTAVNQTTGGHVTAYADSTQLPLTSSTNFDASDNTTGYQIVPVGADGKIDLYTSGGPIALIVDVTGYFTSDATLTGDQTYTPLATATRVLDTRSSTANTTLTATGTVAAGATFTLKVAGVGSVPSNATSVAVNLTATGATGDGHLQVYGTGEAPAGNTSLSYHSTNSLAAASADIPIGTSGNITISNYTSATAVLVDVSGYYTTGTTGQAYHAVSPTRLVDTRNGIGGTAAPIASLGTYTLTGSNVQQITTATAPTLVTMLTEAGSTATAAGYAVAYPADGTLPGTSNLNWISGANDANLALTPTDSNSAMNVYNHSNGTLDLVIDCAGYFSD